MKILNVNDLRKWIEEHQYESETPPTPEDFRLIWPVFGPKVVTQWYGINPQWYPCCAGHEGIDLRAANGTPVLAGARGEVYLVEDNPNSGPYGIQVRLLHDHPDGPFKTVYAHFSKTLVKVGDVVEAGREIGLADNTGNSSGAHLHMTLKKVGDGSDWMNVNDIVNPVPYMPDLFPNGEWRLDVGGNFRTKPGVDPSTLIRYLGPDNLVVCTGEFIDDWWMIVHNSVKGWFWNPGYKMFPR